MFKKILILISVLLVLGLSACSSGTDQPGITFQDKTASVVLEESPTTGYTWAVSIDNENIVSLKDDSYKQTGDKNLDGAGGVHRYVFQANSPGTAVVTFELGQQWSGGEKADQTKKFEITVGQDGKIASLKEQLIS
jgi:predicted secreted protein